MHDNSDSRALSRFERLPKGRLKVCKRSPRSIRYVLQGGTTPFGGCLATPYTVC